MIDEKVKMKWSSLESIEQLQAIIGSSKEKPVLIFKHSTRCGISRMALDRLERNWKDDEMQNVMPCYLDLLKHRDVSDQIAEILSIGHESPQVLFIRNGKSVYDRSQFEINYHDLAALASNPEIKS